MKYNISDIIGKDIISARHGDDMLYKKVIEKMYPDYDFSEYNVTKNEGLELINEKALYNELMKNNQPFRNMLIDNIEAYKEDGFVMDDETANKVYVLATGYMSYIDELIDIGELEVDNTFDYAYDIESALHRRDLNRKERRSKRNNEWKKYDKKL